MVQILSFNKQNGLVDFEPPRAWKAFHTVVQAARKYRMLFKGSKPGDEKSGS